MSKLSFDQWVQVAIAVGTCVAAVATFAVVLVSLWLATRRPKSDLKLTVAKMVAIVGDGTPMEDVISFRVTNLGERSVVLTGISWIAGSGKNKIAMLQLFDEYTPQFPQTLKHAETFGADVYLKDKPKWLQGFADIMVNERVEPSLRTLRVQVGTSLGETISAKPQDTFVEALRGAVGTAEKPADYRTFKIFGRDFRWGIHRF